MSKQQYIFLGAQGALLFLLTFVIGAGIVAATGLPITGALFSGIFLGIVLTIGLKAVPKFGSATIMCLIFSILTIPTSNMGAPGPYKILLGLAMGLTMDIVLGLAHYKKIGYFLAFVAGATMNVLSIYWAAVILGFPTAARLRQMLYMFIGVMSLEGIFSVYLGLKLYTGKLQRLSIFKNLVESSDSSVQ